MKRWVMIAWFGIFMGCITLLTSCGGNRFHDNQVYVVESGSENQEDSVVGWINIQAQSPFDLAEKVPVQLQDGQIFLTASEDGAKYYYMVWKNQWDTMVLKGSVRALVDIYEADNTSKEQRLLAENIVFVSKAKWNMNHHLLALGGNGGLVLYDYQAQKLLLEQVISEETVDDFFWSPLDNDKLYIEQPESKAGGIYYVDSQKKAELYETTERLYYKAKIDDTYCYGTQWQSGQDGEEAVYTVLADRQKQVIKAVGRGSYQDHYLNQVLLSGDNNFGLTYIADVNQVSKGVQLTEEYVYDAKFAANGKIVYITADKETAENRFYLHLVGSNGVLLNQIPVSGDHILVRADGLVGYIGGTRQEVIDLSSGNILHQVNSDNVGEDPMLREALQGATWLYSRMMLGDAVTEEELKIYFANTERMQQFIEQQTTTELPYMYTAKVINMEQNGESSFWTVQIQGVNQENQFLHTTIVYEMIQNGDRWYVLDFSTGDEHGI